jgi:hypothetical protein
MEVGTLAFGAIVLFMLHELDEIIFVRAWLKNRPKARAMWNKNAQNYPSTAALALMIGEEFILFSLAAFCAILFNFPELVISLIIANCVHLCGHLLDAVRIRALPPGTISALLTLILNITLLSIFIAQNSPNIFMILLCTGICSVVLLTNLLILHKISPNFQKFIERVYIMAKH